MKKLFIVLVLAGVGYFAFLKLSPHDEDWLHGEWKYQGAEEDYMTFYENGSVEMRDAERIYARCVYAAVFDNEVGVECKVKGKVHELKYSVSSDGKTLTNREHADSVYTKTGA